MNNRIISNNKLLEHFFDTVEYEDYSVTDWDDDDWLEGHDKVAEVCQVCHTGIKGDRGALLEHLYVEHKKEVKEYKKAMQEAK